MHPSEHCVLATILTYNAPKALVSCLEAIRAQTTPPDGILVVDNASRRPRPGRARRGCYPARRDIGAALVREHRPGRRTGRSAT
jgi:GT2 family glycosyltransferase